MYIYSTIPPSQITESYLKNVFKGTFSLVSHHRKSYLIYLISKVYIYSTIPPSQITESYLERFQMYIFLVSHHRKSLSYIKNVFKDTFSLVSQIVFDLPYFQGIYLSHYPTIANHRKLFRTFSNELVQRCFHGALKYPTGRKAS